jgi:hypothetical protein
MAMLHEHNADQATVGLGQRSIRHMIVALLFGRHRPCNHGVRISIGMPHFDTTNALTPAIT